MDFFGYVSQVRSLRKDSALPPAHRGGSGEQRRRAEVSGGGDFAVSFCLGPPVPFYPSLVGRVPY